MKHDRLLFLLLFFALQTVSVATPNRTIPDQVIPVNGTHVKKISKTVTVNRPTPDEIMGVNSPSMKIIAKKPQLTNEVLENEPPKANARLWNLQDADIISVINEVSLETGKNFIVDPRVSGKISLISSKPIKPSEVYDIFLSVLALLGYSAIPSGDVVKIVPNMESGEYATRLASRVNPGKGDEVVVRVIPLDHVSANQVIPVIRPLLPQWSNVSSYAPGNVIILVGRASNLQRILQIINEIDRTADNGIELVRLRQGSASQMVTVLNNLQSAAKANGDTSTLSIAADERSNSVLLGGTKSARLRARMLINQLDTPSTGVQGNTEVIYLKYLQAKNFAPILGKIAQNMLGKEGGRDLSVALSNSQQSAYGTTTSSTTKIKEAENLTNIQAEPSTNSLIITAPPAMMNALRSIVAKLDLRPAQVLIEGIIVEINQSDLNSLGIQWGSLITKDTIQPGMGFSQFGQGVIGIIPGQQIQAILNILETINNVNILSTPSVVVLDNHKALLDVGQDVPVQTGQYATTGTQSTVTPFNTTSYKKVALALEVTPQINLGNAVRLKVVLKNDSLQNPQNPGLTPLINTSQINNSVIVNNCDILVIGGLISSSLNINIQKVPILGDIPLLGLLFQQKVRQMQKRNLVVFLKPVIMHDGQEATALTFTKYEKMREAQINWPVDLTSTGRQKTENILPIWKNNVDLPKPFER